MSFILSNLRWILAAAAILAAGYAGYTIGRGESDADQLDQITRYQKENAELTDKLEAEKARVKVKTVEVVRTIRDEKDPTGCLDAPLPDSVFSELSDRTGSTLPDG